MPAIVDFSTILDRRVKTMALAVSCYFSIMNPGLEQIAAYQLRPEDTISNSWAVKGSISRSITEGFAGFPVQAAIGALEVVQKNHPEYAAPFRCTNAAGSSSEPLESAAERWLPLPTVGLALSKSLRSQLSPNSTRLTAAALRSRNTQSIRTSNEMYLAFIQTIRPDIARQTTHNSNRSSMTCKSRSSHRLHRRIKTNNKLCTSSS